ncbi:hypothetical protein [Sessilibacter corallicola]|uniref:hypothetical protein n=1 Tax=Sessilibacter corallicola TaxID=2904075 RepID=UPI001E378A0B|nr:hypothetical protein [Sessilibacter corallicola]MCE2028699.1 hypothetical protein [Sessilibacter corallicola]
MSDELDRKIENILISAISDGFNRALNTLEDAGAINREEMRKEYKGVGSKYYDMVSEQFEYTAQYAKETIRELIEEESSKQ